MTIWGRGLGAKRGFLSLWRGSNPRRSTENGNARRDAGRDQERLPSWILRCALGFSNIQFRKERR